MAKEATEDERRKRLALETSSSRDLLEADKTCHMLRKATSAQEIDTQHLREVIAKLKS